MSCRYAVGPERAAVLCVDVRSQIQALEHTVLAKATDRCCARYHMLERGVTYTDLGDDY